MSTSADVIRRYFEHDADRDIDAIVALFSDDATVIDEGQARHGTDEIRAWQTGAASKFKYSTEILAITDGEPGRYVVICAIPTGADPVAYFDPANQSPDGPPNVEGGPPHFTQGMYADLTVE